DPEAMEKVFFNLLSNAVKFTPEGGDVRVSVRRLADGRVEIRVRDTGIGIPREELPYVFDRFHQVDAAVTHTGEGTGIGLSLVKELVTLHGGTIQATSEPGAGTEFVVVLPAALPHTAAPAPDGAPRPAPCDVTRGPLVEMAVFDDDVTDDVPADLTADVPGEMTGDGFVHAALPQVEGDGFAFPGDVTPSAGRPTVLVVDDNPDVREYVS